VDADDSRRLREGCAQPAELDEAIDRGSAAAGSVLQRPPITFEQLLELLAATVPNFAEAVR
jgi:hypothetical protein